jgi:DNA-binding LacI/PurR family transcriptional regulator
MVAVGCYAAFDELGLRCPEDISVIGFNDMPFIDRLRPPLSTVRFPHYQLGTEAAKLLIERIEGGDGPVKILFLAPELVARGSTMPIAPKAVPDLPGEDAARDPRGGSDSNTVPLRRGAAHRGR